MTSRGLLTIFSAISALTIFSIATAPSMAADEAEAWEVKGKLLGKWNKNSGKFKKAEDVSGIDCDERRKFPRLCLVVDDEGRHAQLVTMENGKLTVGEHVPLFDDEGARVARTRW